MAFVPRHKHDVFVSYAHVDDMPFPGTEKGWVTTLVETLEILLAQKLGRRDAYSLWMDHQLSRHARLTPEILENLTSTATLLVVLSPGYLASEWCLREKDSFLNALSGGALSDSRIFIVERDRVELGDRPPELEDLLGYRFWVQEGKGEPPRILGTPWPDPMNPQSMPYFDELTRLACHLADQLKELKEADEKAAEKAADAPAPDAAPTVFLAEVTDDLLPSANALRSCLEQAGVKVLPETWYPREPQAFAQAVDEDLARSSLFVQLLSGLTGRRPPELPQGYLGLQYERAVAAGKPILQWRSPDLDPATVAEEDHRRLLETATVMAVGSEEFKHEVLERALAKPPATPTAPEESLVFVNVEAGDFPLAEALGEALEKHGLAFALPLPGGKPAEFRADLEQNLMFCDALVIVHGGIHAKWVRDQLLLLRKVAWKRDRPLRAVAVYEGPPEEKEPLRFAQPNLLVLNCRTGHDDKALEPFFKALEENR